MRAGDPHEEEEEGGVDAHHRAGAPRGRERAEAGGVPGGREGRAVGGGRARRLVRPDAGGQTRDEPKQDRTGWPPDTSRDPASWSDLRLASWRALGRRKQAGNEVRNFREGRLGSEAN